MNAMKKMKKKSSDTSMRSGSRRLESAAAPEMALNMDMADDGICMKESRAPSEVVTDQTVVPQAEGGEGECKQESQPQQQSDGTVDAPSGEDGVSIDCTKIPQEIDSKFEAIDKEGAVRPTIINAGKVWSKLSQKSLLEEPTTSSLDADAQKKEKNAAFDLLDALSKSGGLTVDHAQMHVVIAATHCFDKNLMDTIVQNNVNPIEKVEMSTLIMASTIHHEPVANMVKSEHLARVLEFSPDLMQIARR
jgi:hypothetical protein